MQSNTSTRAFSWRSFATRCSDLGILFVGKDTCLLLRSQSPRGLNRLYLPAYSTYRITDKPEFERHLYRVTSTRPQKFAIRDSKIQRRRGARDSASMDRQVGSKFGHFCMPDLPGVGFEGKADFWQADDNTQHTEGNVMIPQSKTRRLFSTLVLPGVSRHCDRRLKIPVAALVLLLGIDRFLNEARAVANLIGNGIATIAVAKWEGQFDQSRADAVLNGRVEPEESFEDRRGTPEARRKADRNPVTKPLCQRLTTSCRSCATVRQIQNERQERLQGGLVMTAHCCPSVIVGFFADCLHPACSASFGCVALNKGTTSSSPTRRAKGSSPSGILPAGRPWRR